MQIKVCSETNTTGTALKLVQMKVCSETSATSAICKVVQKVYLETSAARKLVQRELCSHNSAKKVPVRRRLTSARKNQGCQIFFSGIFFGSDRFVTRAKVITLLFSFNYVSSDPNLAGPLFI